MNVQPPGAPLGGHQPPGPAGPAAAAPPQQQALLPFQPQPAGPLTYAEYYQDASNDPYNGEYTAAMQTYNVPLANAAVIAPGPLAQQVYASASTVPMSFVLLCRDPAADPAVDPGRVVLFHRVSQFSARIGMPATPWDNQAFAFKGDVHRHQIVTVNWVQDYFYQIQAQIRVPTVQEANQQLTAQPQAILLGPYNNNDAGTELIRTRRSMYVPPRYVNQFISEDLTPAEAYNRFVGVATADGTMNACAPLVDWLRAAITRSTPQDVSVLEVAYPSVPLADAALINHRWNIVSHDLPSLNPTYQQNQGLQAVAGQLGFLTTEIHQGNEDAKTARTEAQVKTPDQYFGPRLTVLLRLCQVATAAQLPQLYQELSNSKKKQERVVIQQHVDEATDVLNIHHKVIITPGMAKKIASVEWSMDDENNLEHGIHPFHVCYRTPSAQELLRQLVSTHSMVSEHDANPSLQDAQVLLAAEKIDLPLTWAQVRYTLMNTHALCHACLGATHPHTVAVHAAVMRYQSLEPLLETVALPPDVSRAHAPAYFLRWFQLRFSVWMDEQSRSPAMLPPPDYLEIFNRIRHKEYWIPTFPLGFLTPNIPDAAAAFTQTSFSVQPAPAPAPAPVAAPTTSPAATTPGARVANLNWKDIFQPYRSIAIRVRDLKQRCRQNNVDLPKRSDGRTRCPAFHVKGLCNEKCGQKSDHEPASQEDDAVLLTWCQEHWRA